MPIWWDMTTWSRYNRGACRHFVQPRLSLPAPVLKGIWHIHTYTWYWSTTVWAMAAVFLFNILSVLHVLNLSLCNLCVTHVKPNLCFVSCIVRELNKVSKTRTCDISHICLANLQWIWCKIRTDRATHDPSALSRLSPVHWASWNWKILLALFNKQTSPPYTDNKSDKFPLNSQTSSSHKYLVPDLAA